MEADFSFLICYRGSSTPRAADKNKAAVRKLMKVLIFWLSILDYWSLFRRTSDLQYMI